MYSLALTNPIVHAYLHRGYTEGFGVLLLSALAHDLAMQNTELTKMAVDAESRAMPRPLLVPGAAPASAFPGLTVEPDGRAHYSPGDCDARGGHTPSEPDRITGRSRCLRCNALVG